MRALTTVGLKLMGVSSLYGAAEIIPALFSALTMSSNPHSGFNPVWYLAYIVAMFVIKVLIALVLLFRTEWIVTKLQIPSEPLPSSISGFDLLRVGLVIVGVFAVLHAVSESGAVLYSMIQNNPSRASSPHEVGRLIGALLELLLALIVIGNARGIASPVFPASNGEARRMPDN